jgi:ATP-binding cassette, subfamily C (CFTR/MRP), member 1
MGLIPCWLRWLAESQGEHMWFYTGIYFVLTVGAFMSIMTAVTTIFLVIAPHSGNTLHARLLRTVMYAPQSYFAKTDTGTTLNRFSADMAMLDRQLPFALFQVFQTLFRVLSQCVLLSVVQPLITVTLPFTILAVFLIQKIYLATSRQLRFIDLETRALVSGSFLETLEGVATIRAFGWQQAFIGDNARKLDLSLRPDYMLMCIQRWLDMVLDLIVPALAMGIIGLAVALKGTTTGGQIGIALNVVLQVNQYLLRLVAAWTKLETSLGAISRLRAFEQDVQPEDKTGTTQLPPPNWPARGAVEFANLSAYYKPPMLALNDINIAIAPGTKVGIVGRTGSGKSSLLLSLLRLVEMGGVGTVFIDGVNLRNLRRNAVRGRIITVPQDPMLVMTDTIRENLDIEGANVSEDHMVRVLQRVRLWNVMLARRASAEAARREALQVDTSMGLASSGAGNGEGSSINSDQTQPENDRKPLLLEPDDVIDINASQSEDVSMSATAILDTTMRSMPLSQGQQQLFSLARAILMRSSRGQVVLLDEATSNVDGNTDKLMQSLVQEEFKDHTVLTVAHRLDTIMRSDIVLVLDSGKLVEAGPPSELVAKEGGAFAALIHGKRFELESESSTSQAI